MNKFKVPIKNALFMYSYIWDKVKNKDYTNLSAEDDFKSSNIYAELFLINVSKIIKRGLYKEYVVRNDELNTVKGKIDIISTINNQSLKNGKIYCEYDELEENNIYNQILKCIAIRLYKSYDINKENKKKLNKVILFFNQVDYVEITQDSFNRLIFNKSNYHYFYILKICELIFNSQILSDSSGKYMFYDLFDSDKGMEHVFELFVYKFYNYELSKKYNVSYQSEINWQLTGSDISILPVMRMDTLIKTSEETIIIDTKYKKKYTNENFGKKSLVSENMYQMMAYLNNVNASNSLKGILLYPLPYGEKPINESYDCKVVSTIQGDAKLQFITIDLSQDWKKISCDLLYIIDKDLGDKKKEELNI